MLPNLVTGPDDTLETAPVPPMPPPAWGEQDGNANQAVARQRRAKRRREDTLIRLLEP
jgi:hypothetical protein